MSWTINDTAWALLLGIGVISTWCALRARSIQVRRKKEQGR
ncbi:hypothetical protein [Pseudomonas sp. URMO17WK12:I11]|nr:hypothetical protein [Pseudomonas sp. URMO17WK12:I11]